MVRRETHLPVPSAGSASQEPDDLDFPCIVVPDKHLPAIAQLRVDELVERDRPVSNISLRQVRPFLQKLEIRAGLRYQGNGDPVSNPRMGNIVISPRTGC
jgi:hypothetical protein